MKNKDYKIIAIQNYGPSGSTLLHSLLDSHTNNSSSTKPHIS
jgi:hypothetical protein